MGQVMINIRELDEGQVRLSLHYVNPFKSKTETVCIDREQLKEELYSLVQKGLEER